MNLDHIIAKLTLGSQLALRIFKRIFFIKSPGLRDFIAFYRADHLVTFTAEEKDLLQGATRCIHCGLCDAAWKGPLETPPSQWASWMRSVPDFSGHVPLSDDAILAAEASEKVCPEKVPLKKIAIFIREKNLKTHEF